MWTASDVAQTLALVTARRRYYREMLTRVPAAAAVVDADGTITFATPEFCRILGLSSKDVLTRTIEQVFPSDLLTGQVSAALAGISPAAVELEIKEKLRRISATPLTNWRNTSHVDVLILVEDLSEILDPPQTIRIAQAFPAIPQRISDSEIPAIFWQASSLTFAFHSVRGAAGQLLGYPVDHWINTPQFFFDRIHPDDRSATLKLYREAISRVGDASAEFRCQCASAEVWVRETIRVSGRSMAGVITLIGARKRFEEQAIHAARWTALRGFARHSAHDLHNASLAMEGAAQAAVEHVLPEVERISHITGELLNFTSQEPNPPGVVNIPRAFEQLTDKIAAAAGPKVCVELHAGHGLLGFAEESRLDEVILALVSSIARDALENSNLKIACGLETITELAAGATLTPGTYVRISVRHEIRGLDLELQGPLFESFRSSASQPPARLALSRAYAGVRHWGGDIAFSSEPERWAEFLLYLPHCPQFEIDPLEAFEGPLPDHVDESIAFASSVENAIDTLMKELTSAPPSPDLNLGLGQDMPLDSRFSERSLL